MTPKEVLSGAGQYTADQVNVEPKFSPETEPQRRAVYAAEAPWVKYFEYANLPGYAVITVNGANVEARICAGATPTTWKTLRLSKLLRA